jgi:hypothetical protein
MIAFIIMGIVLLSMIGTAMYSLMSMTEQTLSLTKNQSDRQSIEAAEAMVINRLKPIGVNQRLIAPAGTAGTNHQEIPQEWGIKTSNPYGYKIVYCPMGDEISGTGNGLTSGNIKLSATEDYAIRYTTDDKGTPYVAQSGFIKDSTYENVDLIALLISPKSGDSISCSDIYLDSDKFRIKNSSGSGLVRAITKKSVTSYQANQPVLISATKNSSSSFNEMSNYWQSIQPLRYTIDLDMDGIKEISSDINFINEYPGNNKEIIIRGGNPLNNNINSQTSATIAFENISATIENVSFNQNIKLIFRNSDIRIENSNINGEIILVNSKLNSSSTSFNNGASLQQSKWIMEGTNTISNPSNLSGEMISAGVEILNSDIIQVGATTISIGSALGTSVSIKNGTWSINGATTSINTNHANSNSIRVYNNSSLILDDGTIELNSNNTNTNKSIDIDETSKFSARSGSIKNLSTINVLLNNSGIASLHSSSISNGSGINNAIYLSSTGLLSLEDTQIGSASNQVAVGVNANGGVNVSGSGAHIYASSCWSGSIFSYTGSQSQGSSFKGVLDVDGNVDPLIHYDDVYQTINNSNWGCN